jgi:hypothetical protein
MQAPELVLPPAPSPTATAEAEPISPLLAEDPPAPLELHIEKDRPHGEAKPMQSADPPSTPPLIRPSLRRMPPSDRAPALPPATQSAAAGAGNATSQ